MLCNSRTMDMAECFANVMNPYKTVNHVLMFHIKTFTDFKKFFNQFTLMINGRNSHDTTQNRGNHDGNITMGGFSTTVSSVPRSLGKKFEWKKVRMNQNLCSHCFLFENKETEIF